MKTHHQKSNSWLWPLAVLFLLTIGVFFSTKELPHQQDVRSRAQVDQSTATISLAFSVPGIASQSGNIQPLHPSRNVILKFYDPDSNTLDAIVNPLYVVQTQATFDSDPTSSTYGEFVKTNLTVGDVIPNGDYQIAIKTDQAVQTLIKAKPGDLGGEIFTFDGDTQLDLPPQTVVTGDIAPLPNGDNHIDDADYQALRACFGQKVETATCDAKQLADLDDNGVIDGVDYNLWALGLKRFGPSNQPVSPTPGSVFSPSSTATPTPLPIAASPAKHGNLLVLFILIFTFFVLLGGAFFFLKKARTSSVENKEYYIKKHSEQNGGVWLTVADDSGQKLGFYQGTVAKEGFARIKGIMKQENGKSFIAISEIMWEKKD